MSDQPQGESALNTLSAAAQIETLLDDAGDLPGDEQPEAEQAEVVAEEDETVIEEETEEETAEAEESEAEVEESDETEPAEEEGAGDIETLDQMAEALEVPLEELMDTLKIKIKVNGEESYVTLAEAQKGQQFEADYRQKTTALAEQSRQQQEANQQVTAQIQQRMVELNNTFAVVEGMIQQEFQTPEMQALRQNNPAEWNARVLEGQQRLNNLYEQRNNLGQHQQAQMEQQQQQQQQNFQQMIDTQQNALLEQMSDRKVDWTGDKKKEVGAFIMERYGYSPDEIAQAYDHRMILMAMDAMNNVQAVDKAEVAAKKVKKLPRMQKPGKVSTPVSLNKKRVANLKMKAKQTGKVRDAAAAIEALL